MDVKWKKVSEEKPSNSSNIIYKDNEIIALLYIDIKGKASSYGYACNDSKCSWIYDDCGCEFILQDHGYWMEFPIIEKESNGK